MESVKKSFKSTIELLKRLAGEKGIVIPDNEIAREIEVSDQLFLDYYSKNDAPDEVFSKLQARYKHILGNRLVISAVHSSEHFPPDPEPNEKSDI